MHQHKSFNLLIIQKTSYVNTFSSNFNELISTLKINKKNQEHW